LPTATHNGSFFAGRVRLSYQQTAALFSEASGSATHDAEDGTGTPMQMISCDR
jgi:hypothetical protein